MPMGGLRAAPWPWNWVAEAGAAFRGINNNYIYIYIYICIHYTLYFHFYAYIYIYIYITAYLNMTFKINNDNGIFVGPFQYRRVRRPGHPAVNSGGPPSTGGGTRLSEVLIEAVIQIMMIII